MNIYRIEHIDTKEVHEGTSKELGNIIGVVPGTICKKALEYGLIADKWRAKKIAENVSRKKKVEEELKKESEKATTEVKEVVKPEKCMYCGKDIPIGRKSNFCNGKCGIAYRQKAQNELMREEYQMRVGKLQKRKKPTLSIAEIDARAKAAGMHYGQYVAMHGL